MFGVARPGQLREELPALDLPVVGYHVLPTAADAGMMEVVADSKTIYEITARRDSQGKFTHEPARLLAHIMERNEGSEAGLLAREGQREPPGSSGNAP